MRLNYFQDFSRKIQVFIRLCLCTVSPRDWESDCPSHTRGHAPIQVPQVVWSARFPQKKRLHARALHAPPGPGPPGPGPVPGPGPGPGPGRSPAAFKLRFVAVFQERRPSQLAPHPSLLLCARPAPPQDSPPLLARPPLFFKFGARIPSQPARVP